MIEVTRCMGLSTEGLVEFEDGLMCLPEAKEAFLELRECAAREGFELKACSAFRSFEAQAAIFGAKFRGDRPILDANEEPLSVIPEDPVERIRAILRFSAMPGFSRHHFGSDFDVYAPNKLPEGQKLQLTSREYDHGAYFYELGCFLRENLRTYGFGNPYQGGFSRPGGLPDDAEGAGLVVVGNEPWHISHLATAQEYLREYDLQDALDYVAGSDLEFAPYVRSVMTLEQADAMLRFCCI